MNVMQVLIIDINHAERMLIAESVISIGHAIVHVETAQDALNYIKQHPADLIIMDVDLPVLNGLELTKQIRAEQVDEWFPILLMSDRFNAELYSAGIKAGATGFIDKPINSQLLQMQIKALEPVAKLRKQLHAAQLGVLKLNDTLKYLSMFDQLTGLANRRNFDDTLRREFKLAQREKASLCLLICDIDYFQLFNDKHGHVAGDDCLSAVATALAAVSNRPTDLACRYGSDEFTVILPKTDLKGAMDIAEKIRKAIIKQKILHQDSPVSPFVTFSIGISCFNGQYSYANEMTKTALELLMVAKGKGYNRIEVNE